MAVTQLNPSVQGAAMKVNEGIRVEDVKSCQLCQRLGNRLYDNLRDRLFNIPGVWGFLCCPNCGLVWLDPRPIADDISKTYSPWEVNPPTDQFYSFRKKLKRAVLAAILGNTSRALPLHWRWIGRMVSLVPPLREMVTMKILGLDGCPHGMLVDIGSGSGELLATMNDLGWEVLGVEPDAEAARIAQERRHVSVKVGTLEEVNLPSEFAEVVTLNHVLEHVPDPAALLRECHRILKPSGRLVVLTPNCQSLGHMVFGRAWLALEQPRHLYLYSLETLRTVAVGSGFQVKELRTTARNARGTWWRSLVIYRKGRVSGNDRNPLLTATSWAFQVVEEGLRHVWPKAGEELFMVATASALASRFGSHESNSG